MNDIGWLFISITDMLFKLMQAISPRFRARCFYADYNYFRVPGDHQWNAMVLETLMSEYY